MNKGAAKKTRATRDRDYALCIHFRGEVSNRRVRSAFVVGAATPYVAALVLADSVAGSTNGLPRCRVPGMSRPTAVHHVALKVQDLARAERFFVQTLGLAVLRRWPASDGEGERSLWLDLERGRFWRWRSHRARPDRSTPDRPGCICSPCASSARSAKSGLIGWPGWRAAQ